jgi:hypothetical protein
VNTPSTNIIQNNFASGYNYMNRKPIIALLAIWVFVLVAVINVYLTNDQYLLESNSLSLNSNTAFSDNSQNLGLNKNNTGNQNYALVQYNKKLILTKFTGIISQPNASTKGTAGKKNGNKGQGIIVIKNQNLPKPTAGNEFSVKPIPQ